MSRVWFLIYIICITGILVSAGSFSLVTMMCACGWRILYSVNIFLSTNIDEMRVSVLSPGWENRYI